LIFRFWLFGLFIGLLIFWIVFLEFFKGIKEHGLKHEIKETILAILFALLIWFGLGFILQTSSPINAIVSCSMLPHLSRGDLVVISGAPFNAPLVEVSQEQIEEIGNAEVFFEEKSLGFFNGSLFSFCSQAQAKFCEDFIKSPEKFKEKHGKIILNYEKCELSFHNKTKAYTPCVSFLEINGKTYYESLSNDIVVFSPKKSDYYSNIGDIIHRSFVILKTENGTYFLTKGDNNPIFDFQVYSYSLNEGNSAVEISQYKGKVLNSNYWLSKVVYFAGWDFDSRRLR